MGQHSRGRRATGPAPSWLLVAVGLLVAVVAAVVLLLQLRDPDAADRTAAPDDAHPSATSSGAQTSDTATETGLAPDPTSGAATSPSTGQADGSTAASAYQEPQAEATSVRIDAAGVDSTLVPQGLADDGTINPDSGQVIWFTGNDRVPPGRTGTSVIAGHVTWNGAPDVFAGLSGVQVGDSVEVGYADGTSRSFTVTHASAHDKQAIARSLTIWGEHPTSPRLAIITCDDDLGYQSDGHAVANFVVIAEPA